jgi:soluble lytic murein transglycosylase
MKHKIFAQFFLLLSLVVSCSEVPTSKHLTNDGAGQASDTDEQINSHPDAHLITEAFQKENLPSIASPEQRLAFLQAEQFLLRHNENAFLVQMAQLKTYPLYPYLQAQWLRKKPHKTTEIETFLDRYPHDRYADVLRLEWLPWLVKNQQWQKFIEYYHPETDAKKTALHCSFAWAQYQTGNQAQALQTAHELWLSGMSHASCDALFAAFQQSPVFTEEMLWQRFSANLRAKKANLNLAAQLKQAMPAQMQKMADLWLKVHNRPSLISQLTQWDMQDPKTGEIFAHGVARMLTDNFSLGFDSWDLHKAKLTIPSDAIDDVEQKIGLAFASAGYSSYAYSHLILVNKLEENARHTLVRAALREQNWSHIAAALTKLTDKEKNEDKWRYWQARALAETGKMEEARPLFAELAKKSNFYAFLAADKLNVPYRVADIPVPVTEQDLKTFQQQEPIKVVAEWLLLERKDEALKQWWHTVKKSPPQQIMVAAKLAQRWHMVKLAAFTIAKADYWNDLDLRFPVVYAQEINTYSVKHNLDSSIVFGLIRQESVFDELAGSNVGARGLMQIMPGTGKQIARQMQEPWRSDACLYEPDTNVKYGTFYYKQLLDKFNGQVALAAAGYNAGPGRVKKWAPDKPMAMDIWIETIPFNETRQYVSMVLSNTLFYQHRMNRDVLKMADFMHDVLPSS